MISITLPSIRREALERTLDNIDSTTKEEFEVIVCAPFAVREHRLGRRGFVLHVWDDEEKGCNAAHAEAAKIAQGEFITAWVDDHLYVDGWDVTAVREYDVYVGRSPLLLGLKHADREQLGSVFGKYYPYFPFMRRSHVSTVGWFGDDYKSGFADVELAMRVYNAGGQCQPTSRGVVLVHQDDERKGETVNCHPEDMELFVQRWGPVFGVDWDTSHLRGFNVDVRA